MLGILQNHSSWRGKRFNEVSRGSTKCRSPFAIDPVTNVAVLGTRTQAWYLINEPVTSMLSKEYSWNVQLLLWLLDYHC